MLTINKQITYSDVDYTGKIKMSSLFELLAHLATQDAINLGMWNIEMMNQYGWVVSKQSLNLKDTIYLNDNIEITTYIGKGSLVIFPRYYIIKKNNKIVGEVSSIWTLIDLKNRRITAPKRIGLHIPEVEYDYQLEKPKTIDNDEAMVLVNERQVLYSDIDTNGHMNNCRYIEWALDLIDLDVFKNKSIQYLAINYLKEIQPLKMVKLYLYKEHNLYIIKGSADDEDKFLMEVIFE
jgi:acyl-ACP thioesterase